MEERKHIIKVANLAVGYGSKPICSSINFSLEKGAFCAIIGANGIGKSTLLRTLAKLQERLDGTIFLDSLEQKVHSPNSLSKTLSVVLTEPIVTKNLSVKDLVALGRQPFTNWLGQFTPEDISVIQRSLETFDLATLAERKCFELSDGQLQRALVARAMAQDTPIILLDEPTTHLDLYHKVQIFTLLKQLAHQHQKTIVFTTHEIDLAIQLCDNIVILDGKTNPFASPCQLIEKGCFDTLFPKEIVKFDAKTGTFKVNE